MPGTSAKPLTRCLALLLVMMGSQYAAAELVLEGFWVRAMPPTQTMTAAYGRITNGGSEAVRVTGASSDVAADTSLHESRQSGDQVRMVAMGEVQLAVGESLELAPGGAHLMLMGIATMPAPDSEVEICIHSGEDNSCVAAPVQRQAEPTGHHHHH